ncbi:MAG: sigma 54-interacting transcriptional regulator [Deltaproteobacteria bacterium]|nr:sigma 54-interacting transcriptional regulator [Deltaproteobacteria bacterium]MDQ3297008.1 sigma 54-interacting transcriptional regulator [Myxococcota bacterium]
MSEPTGRTTGLRAIVDPLRIASSWYVVVALPGDGGSRVVPIADGAELVIGRHPECDVPIDDDALSRRHAVMRSGGGSLVVEDLGSRNGTTINGNPINAARRLAVGDVIAIGPVTVIVARSTPSRGRQLATLGELEERLDIEVERALRYRRSLGLAMLRFEGNDDARLGHVEQVMRQLRRMDLVAEYGPDELAVVLPETTQAATELVAQRMARIPGARCRFGIAAFPEDGASPGALIGVARTRLRGTRAVTMDDGQSSANLARVVPKLVVVDPMMKQVYKLAARAAPTTISVLVVGETGTGKEMVAEAIHRLGSRADGPFVRINCAALSDSLVESELFGHEAGAFTGATRTTDGVFAAASGGTLFLDEVGELPLVTQAKLLRVLERWTIVRVGGTREIAVDVRLVCATNRDLESEVQHGRFREDLFYRIAKFVIPVPPLRDRRSEILPLAVQFAHEIATELRLPPVGFMPEALDALKAGDWPGNVRELRNVIERAVVLADGERVDRPHLPEHLTESARSDRPEIRQRVADVEREMLRVALEAAGGNQTRAAKQLGLSRFALIRLLTKHGLKPAREPQSQ